MKASTSDKSFQFFSLLLWSHVFMRKKSFTIQFPLSFSPTLRWTAAANRRSYLQTTEYSYAQQIFSAEGK
jgi:hypothetical protein